MCSPSTCGPAIPTARLVCLDETSKQLIAETRVPIDEAWTRIRVDYEYERNGTSNVFMLFAPLEVGATSK
jgi:hypothetical protein